MGQEDLRIGLRGDGRPCAVVYNMGPTFPRVLGHVCLNRCRFAVVSAMCLAVTFSPTQH